MEEQFGQGSIGHLVGGVDSAVSALGESSGSLASDRELLDALLAATRVEARLHAWRARVAARLDAREAAWREHGTSMSTWLADVANLTRREASRLVRHGQELDKFATVGMAAGSGAVLPEQAEAITGVLSDLPDDLPSGLGEQAQELMVGFAANHNSVELRRLTHRLVELLAPDTAEALEAARVERDHRIATRSRHLTFTPDHRGSILLRGSLPIVEAEPLVRIIDAYAAAHKRALDALDPNAEYVTPAMRRADALLAMVQHHQQSALAPTNGGDRPRVVVALSYDSLIKAAVDGGLLPAHLSGGGMPNPAGAGGLVPAHLVGSGIPAPAGEGGLVPAHLVGSGIPVPAGVLRRWLCDADLLPAVLGGDSQPLDVGRAQRLVTPAIRAALELRDGGCVFPGCDKPPQACHAHHLQPWWAGGSTSMPNLVLVCPHHHGIVEPGHDPTADRWQVQFGASGVAEVVPPLRVDPARRPRRHARFQDREDATPSSRGGPGSQAAATSAAVSDNPPGPTTPAPPRQSWHTPQPCPPQPWHSPVALARRPNLPQHTNSDAPESSPPQQPWHA